MYMLRPSQHVKQHQLVAGKTAYENFCTNDNALPINSTKPSLQSPIMLRSRQMNGGDSPLSPSSSIAWQDHQQTVQALHQELEERKRNEAQLHYMLRTMKQQQVALDQVNGPSLTPDGLPAAPSSDGILESVKDGYIRRLGREITVLKANLHEAENKLGTAQKERDSAFQRVASLSSLLADSDRRATNLHQQLSGMTIAMVGEGGKMDTLNEIVEKQKAEISTLKESVQRLSRENQCLKESAAVISSRQPSSLGTNSGSSSVAGCSQELDYLHKVVDTLKATVQEQHAKLCSLRSLHDKANQASSSTLGSVKAQSFPVAPIPSVTQVAPASLAIGVQKPEGRPVVTLDNSEWSVDCSGFNKEGLSRPATFGMVATALTLPNSNSASGVSSNMNVSSRSNQAVQDDETVNSLGNVMEKLKLSNVKPIPGVASDGRVPSESDSRLDAVENPGYFLSPQKNFNLTSQSKLFEVPSDSPASGSLNSVAGTSNATRSHSMAVASQRGILNASAAASVPTSSGMRPLSKSEVIAVSTGLARPSINRSSSTQLTSGALSKTATAQDMLAALSGSRPEPPLNPATMATSTGGGVGDSNFLASKLPLVPGMVGAAASPTALQLTRHARPQFVFEAEIDEMTGGSNYQQQVFNNYQQQQQQRLPSPPASSSAFTPQPPPQPHQVGTGTSSSSPLAIYQTASTAVTSNREGMHVLNKHMMGGGNVIYQQSPSQLLQPKQVLLGGMAALPHTSQILNFTSQAVSPHESQQPQLPPMTNLSPPRGNQQQQTLYSNISPQGKSQQLDPSGPRVNSDRTCPVCGQDFSHLPMENFQAHVYECFDEAGPETMKAPGDEKSLVGGNSRASDRTCPVCNATFESTVPQSEFERHVHSHFGEENFEIVS
ncbi:hypothetical protein ElyMa_006151300 [Elysia marginata]|uniref:UBZ1-type domain-containing protein n=1 Tax=Elysia marginata TaxID=1093978 RepID=A0AAV4GX82_9GAST|nr:hypothetical protein ElyMa_006151300 [Elysia marginata]